MKRELILSFACLASIAGCATPAATQQAQSTSTLAQVCSAYTAAATAVISRINAGKLTKSETAAVLAASTDAQKYCGAGAAAPTNLQAAITAVTADTTTITAAGAGATK